MKLSFSTRGWGDLSWDTWLETALEMKFTGIEVYNLFKFPALTAKGGPLHPHRLAATLRQLRDKKLSIPCLDTSLDLTESRENADILSDMLTYARDLRVPYVVCWASKGDEASENALCERIAALLPKAEELGVGILLKTSGIFADTSRLRRFLEQYASDWLGALWDMHHPYRDFGESADTTIKNLGTYVKHVHLRDSDDNGDYQVVVYKNVTGTKYAAVLSVTFTVSMEDEFAPYILFTNSFDGSGAVKVMFTPIRVFCSNALVRAIKNATNKLSIRHSSSLQSRLDNARYVLLNNTNYLNALKAESEKLAVTPFSAEAFEALAKSLFPVNTEDKEFVQLRNAAQVEALLRAYRQDDLANFKDTAYKAVQAVADFESHKPTFRQTAQTDLKNIKTVMLGMPLLNQITERMLAIA